MNSKTHAKALSSPMAGFLFFRPEPIYSFSYIPFFVLYGFLLKVFILIFEYIFSQSKEPSVKTFLEVAARDAHADDGE